jgi:hypothetical protein
MFAFLPSSCPPAMPDEPLVSRWQTCHDQMPLMGKGGTLLRLNLGILVSAVRSRIDKTRPA